MVPLFTDAYRPKLVGISTGETMGDELCIYCTNAPKEAINKLVVASNKEKKKGNYLPNFEEYLQDRGFITKYIDSCTHVTPYKSSREWQQENYPEVTEFYYID